MPNPNGAGDLPLDEYLTGVLTIRKGDIERNPRRGDKRQIALKVSDGFNVLRARVDAVVRPLGVPEGFVLYFRRTKKAVQSEFKELTAENFDEFLRYRWAKITGAEVAKWDEEHGKTPKEMPVFEFDVYRPDTRAEPAAKRMQQATQHRIAEARPRLQEHNNQNNIRRGDTDMGHLAVVNARRGDGHEETAAAAAAATVRNDTFRQITIKMNGTEVQVEVNVTSLRNALGLPP
ncbi:MAG: hypothetical protein SGBAC_008379 [Bacillariaceae sp.]